MKSLKLVGGDGKYRGPFSKGLAGSFEADAFEFALRGVRRTQHRDKQGQPIFIVFLSYEALDHLSPDGPAGFEKPRRDVPWRSEVLAQA